jgi:hypothetical protein
MILENRGKVDCMSMLPRLISGVWKAGILAAFVVDGF